MAEEFWDDAERWLGELLQTATELEGILDDADKKVQKARIKEARKFLNELCTSLKKVVAALEGKSSPLGKFFADARDVPPEKDKQKAKELLTAFLDNHEKHLTKAPKWAVDRLRDVLEDFAAETIEYGAKVEDLKRDLLKNIKLFQEQTCKCAEVASQIEDMLSPKLLRAIVMGARGVVTVGIDITTVVKTAPVGLLLIYHAVKSTWTGSRMVYKATIDIKDELPKYLDSKKKKK